MTLRPRLILSTLVFLALAIWQHESRAADINFAWDAAPSTAVTGYEMGCGPTTGTYPTIRSAGNALSFKWLAMTDGSDNFCNVRAFNAAGVRSAWANEVKVTIPLLPPTNLRQVVTTSLYINGVQVAQVNYTVDDGITEVQNVVKIEAKP